MMELDHIAVSCTTLEEGRAAVEAALGLPLQAGGKHDAFGTHNLLMGLADGLYLEVIAIDPDAPPPGRTRWFNMDNFRGLPRVTNWICRTGDLDGDMASAPDGAGTPLALSRGDLSWRVAVPDSGVMPCRNLFPTMIQWDGTAHPAARLTQVGCTLKHLVVETPEADAFKAILAPILKDARVVVEDSDRTALHAAFETPSGLRWL